MWRRLAEQMGEQTASVGTRPQLLVDDYLVSESQGLTEHTHQMAKHPSPVLKAEAAWERPQIAGLAGAVNASYDADEGLFKLWYYARGTFTAGTLPGVPSLSCFATSRDGINFERPELGLMAFDGSTANNILNDDIGPGHGMLDCAEMAGVEPADMRFKSVGWMGFDDSGQGMHGVSFSPDGLRWRTHDGNPVIRGREHGDSITSAKLRDSYYRLDDPPGFPSGKYALFPKVHVPLGPWRRRCIGMCTSEAVRNLRPFAEWSTPLLALAPDQRDDEMTDERLAANPSPELLIYDHPDDHRCEFYGMLAFRYGDVMLGLLWIFDAAFEGSRLGGHNQQALVDVQLVSSRNLVHWHRAGNRQPVLTRGDPESFDSAMIFYHSLPLTVGDEWWVYYCGHATAHSSVSYADPVVRERFLEDVRAGRRQFPAIGLAKIRREGFISLDAGPEGGWLATRRLRPGGGQLTVNANVATGGELRVEVQAPSGEPLPGYGLADCTPITGDGVRQSVRWGARVGDPSWTERDVRLKFEIRDAELYAFQFADPAR